MEEYPLALAYPQYLVETAWLEAHINDPDLRILDCTVLSLGGGESGWNAWAERHIPGSAFADLTDELSDPESDLPYMLPSATQFANAMSRYGVGEGTRVVLYDSTMNICATRVWWMLRAFGFDRATVLNGGWRKWTMERRPDSTAPPAYPCTRFFVRARLAIFVDKHDVFTAIHDGKSCIINALRPEDHLGTTRQYARAGHIPSSVNVPARAILDPETHTYLCAEQLLAKFTEVGAIGRDRVITYCGGGIAAASVAFALLLLGAENVAIYDGSLFEWAADPDLPLEVG